jgi:beta-xylosidase
MAGQYLVSGYLKCILSSVALTLLLASCSTSQKEKEKATNPIIWADVPDMSMIRVDDIYYMSSTTMHMNPGVPIMKSTDLVNWKLVSYAYDTLVSNDAMNLENGEKTYGRGSWASSLRFHEGTYYVSTFSATSGMTHIYTTKDIENGLWKEHSFSPSLHDNSLIFEDGRVYMIWGAGEIRIVELEEDLSGMKPGTEQILIENATAPSGDNIMLPAEGSQMFKAKGEYYLFNISWPRDGMRTVIIHRSDSLLGDYEGRVALQDRGIAQGGLIDTPEGDWYAYLFRDFRSVGRIPYLAPMTWEDGWPVIGIDGVIPDTLDLPASRGLIPGIVDSDDFTRLEGDEALPLVWQWNHNPIDEFWSVTERPGYLRITNDRADDSFLSTRNTLTQRTIGPESSGIIKIDVSNMKNGDIAGLGALQANYGYIAVKMENDSRSIVMAKGTPEEGEEIMQEVQLDQNTIYLKSHLDFRDWNDTGTFHYSLNGEEWKPLGSEIKMSYTLPHFMGYRFALFNYASEIAGGYVDFDFFKIE